MVPGRTINTSSSVHFPGTTVFGKFLFSVSFVRLGSSGDEDSKTISCETPSGLTRAITEDSGGSGSFNLTSRVMSFPAAMSVTDGAIFTAALSCACRVATHGLFEQSSRKVEIKMRVRVVAIVMFMTLPFMADLPVVVR